MVSFRKYSKVFHEDNYRLESRVPKEKRIKHKVDLTPEQLCTINANSSGSQLVNLTPWFYASLFKLEPREEVLFSVYKLKT